MKKILQWIIFFIVILTIFLNRQLIISNKITSNILILSLFALLFIWLFPKIKKNN